MKEKTNRVSCPGDPCHSSQMLFGVALEERFLPLPFITVSPVSVLRKEHGVEGSGAQESSILKNDTISLGSGVMGRYKGSSSSGRLESNGRA